MKSFAERCRTLGSGAVSKGVDVDATGRLLLDAIVADRRGRVERFLEVALLQAVAHLAGMRPHTGVAISLQLEPHGHLVRVVRALFLEPPDLRVGAQQVLHVMTELVRKYVVLREVSGSPEPLLQLL